MLSIEETKKILGDKDMLDEEAQEIRDGFRNLAEIIYEKWEHEKKMKNTK